MSLVVGVILPLIAASLGGFKSEQTRHPRVKAAIAEKQAGIKLTFQQKGLPYPPRRIFIRIFKREQLVELWVSTAAGGKFELLKQYNFCASSGGLGPKRRQGDGQIPEGFYHVDRFNPASNFHLSLGINYPNQSDRTLGAAGQLGGDIFIHGGCVTIGCVPITDDGIKELYVVAVEARSAGQLAIPVHIFPTRLDDKGLRQLETEFAGNPALVDFWRGLKSGFDFFEAHRTLPRISADRSGRYIVRG